MLAPAKFRKDETNVGFRNLTWRSALKRRLESKSIFLLGTFPNPDP